MAKVPLCMEYQVIGAGEIGLMGQQEVIDWLVKQRRLGIHSFHSIKEVQRGLLNDGHTSGTSLVSVSLGLHALRRGGFVEMRMKTGNEWLRVFRLRDEYCDSLPTARKDKTPKVEYPIIPEPTGNRSATRKKG